VSSPEVIFRIIYFKIGLAVPPRHLPSILHGIVSSQVLKVWVDIWVEVSSYVDVDFRGYSSRTPSFLISCLEVSFMKVKALSMNKEEEEEEIHDLYNDHSSAMFSGCRNTLPI
jgi:hypothetical protein